MNLVKVKVPRAIPAQAYCTFLYDGHRIGTTLPVAMQEGDTLTIDIDSGEPYTLYRQHRGFIWVCEPPAMSFTIPLQMEPEQAAQLRKIFNIV